MSQSLEAHEFRDATLSQVKAAVDTLLDVSADDEAADVLLSFGLSLRGSAAKRPEQHMGGSI